MVFRSPGAHVKDADQFVPPKYGGSLAVKHGNIVFGNTTATTIFTLPAGAVMVDWLIEVITGFDGTASTFDLGTGGTADNIVDGMDISSAAIFRYGDTGFDPDTILQAPLAEDTIVTGLHITGGGSPAAGELSVTCVYYLTDELPS